MKICFICENISEKTFDTQVHLCQDCAKKSIRKYFLKCKKCGGWGEEWIASTTRDWLEKVVRVIDKVIEIDSSFIIITNNCPGCYNQECPDDLDELMIEKDEDFGYYDC